MCGEKQSIKRHYGLGNGLECRKHVQKLNGIRGELDECKSSQSISTGDEESENENNTTIAPKITASVQNKQSKWSDFVENTAENLEVPNNDDKMYLNHTEVVLEMPKKRRKILGKRSIKNENNRTCSNTSDLVESNENDMLTELPKHEPCPSFSRMQESNVMKRTFTPPIKNNNSPTKIETPFNTKWNELDNESDKSTFKTEQPLSQTNNVMKIKYKPPAINKNSKWAKFAEDSDHEENDVETPVNTQSDPKTLFSLCDDNDLDEYLTI
ncbi:MRN complex-interacting protein-like [Ostrinia nubilalis]|uniref:MRN complex-interacting protein-like n=1 Tax=Ostrinia nubilalis TaxID=29057 RepID=UPI0030825F52